MLYIYGHSLV